VRLPLLRDAPMNVLHRTESPSLLSSGTIRIWRAAAAAAAASRHGGSLQLGVPPLRTYV